MRATLQFLRLVLIMMTGRRYYLLPLLPLVWTVIQAVLVFLNDARLTPSDVQGPLIGVPLAALGVFLGARIVAAEIDERSIEIAYTVPGAPSGSGGGSLQPRAESSSSRKRCSPRRHSPSRPSRSVCSTVRCSRG